MIDAIASFSSPSISVLVADIASRHSLRRGSGRWSGPCPKCGGSARSDKFVIKEDGGFKCYACDFKGDIVTWLREMEGKSCAEAHEIAGLPCLSHTCAVRGTCRFGDGSGRRLAPSRRSVAPPQAQAQSLPVCSGSSPLPQWRDWAEELLAKAEWRLRQHPDVLGWLAARGIDEDAAARFRLGWLAHDSRVKRHMLGLAPRNGKDTLWLPEGLVIPTLDDEQRVNRLRIRRPDASRERFLPDLKYVWLEGSGTLPMTIRPERRSRGVMIVEAELDAMAVAAAHERVTAIAIGSVSAGVPASLCRELEQAPTILITLDADHGRDGRPGPGPEAVKKWLGSWRQARFWPVPKGKDPGDYARAGFALRPWIESGLVPELPPSVAHEPVLSPGSTSEGGTGRDSSPADAALPAIEPVHRIVTLVDGREIYVTDDRGTWEKLTAAGKIVFSENGLKRIQLACGAMTDEERTALAMQVVDLKETFAGAYVRHGEVLA